MGGLHALLVVEDGLADTQIVRRDLQQLIIRQKFQALLQTHLPRRHQPQRIIGAGGTGVCLLLFLADIYGDVLLLRRHAYHHTLVHLHARADKERTPLLGVKEPVGDGLTRLKGYKGPGIPAIHLALIGCVAVKDAGHDALAPGVGKELVAVAEQPPGRDQELHLHAASHRGHLHQVALPGADLLDNRAHRLAGHIHHQALDRLALLAVDGLIQHPGR